MSDVLPSGIFPCRWFPFEGPQEQIEEVVHDVLKFAGNYDTDAIPNCAAQYLDDRTGTMVTVVFQDGEIWKIERRRERKKEPKKSI